MCAYVRITFPTAGKERKAYETPVTPGADLARPNRFVSTPCGGDCDGAATTSPRACRRDAESFIVVAKRVSGEARTMTRVIVVAAVAAVVVACGASADIEGTPLDGRLPGGGLPLHGAAEPGSDPNGASGCIPGGQAPKLPPLDPATLPSCCSEGAAHCMPEDRVARKSRASLTPCTGGYCVPDPIIRSGGAPQPPCASVGGATGVCLSVCVPQVAQYKATLPQANCAPDERCAPCINPLTQRSSGACEIGAEEPNAPVCTADGGASSSGDTGGSGGDTGGAGVDAALPCPHVGPPVVDPATFASCGQDPGAHCVDVTLVPEAMRGELATCPTGLCVPDPFLASGGRFVPATCKSVGQREGRCVHTAVPRVASQRDLLPRSTCGASERCVPCYDPRDGTETKACRQSCDPGPTTAAPGPPQCPHVGPPVLDAPMLPVCGGSGGAHCLPSALVPQAMASELAVCGATGGKCVPDVFIESGGRYVPPTCNSVIGAEGRCLHVGLASVAGQKDKLPQGTCKTYERCVPCYSPLDGTDTGACRQSCDPGPARPKTLFPSCCYDGGRPQGKCVPSSLVPAATADKLASDICSGGQLCAPTENLTAGYVAPRCTGFALLLGGTYSGACVSRCVPFSGLQNLVLKQGTCNVDQRCVPCYQGGASTGACD